MPQTIDLHYSVVNVPDGDKSPAVVVYGGLYGWEGAWLLPQIPTALKERILFILPKHYSYDCRVCLNEVSQKQKPNISSWAICGYSLGGLQVYRNLHTRPWKILGLIDPTAPTMGGFAETVLDSASSKICCVYWVPNWGKDGYNGKIPRFAEHLRNLKVRMVEAPMTHRFMPDHFFTKFGHILLAMP